jgi:hypothetical protein
MDSDFLERTLESQKAYTDEIQTQSNEWWAKYFQTLSKYFAARSKIWKSEKHQRHTKDDLDCSTAENDTLAATISRLEASFTTSKEQCAEQYNVFGTLGLKLAN